MIEFWIYTWQNTHKSSVQITFQNASLCTDLELIKTHIQKNDLNWKNLFLKQLTILLLIIYTRLNRYGGGSYSYQWN